MAEKKTNYDQLLSGIRQPQQGPVKEAPPPGVLLPEKAPKPQGKRSDPAWKQYSVLLKKDSHKQASVILRQKYDGTDISDLMQALLERWLETEK